MRQLLGNVLHRAELDSLRADEHLAWLKEHGWTIYSIHNPMMANVDYEFRVLGLNVDHVLYYKTVLQHVHSVVLFSGQGRYKYTFVDPETIEEQDLRPYTYAETEMMRRNTMKILKVQNLTDEEYLNSLRG